jgi:hypothetical protein
MRGIDHEETSNGFVKQLLLLAVCGCVQQGANQTQPTQARNAPTESKPAVKYVEVSLLEY